MDKEKEVAYCGLCCLLCSNKNCGGCKSGECEDKKWCKNYKCCSEKSLNGCYECEQFPCGGGMLDKLKIRAFSRFVKEYGQEELVKCLTRNEKDGVIYHRGDSIFGDYDDFSTEEDIINFIRHGKK